MAKATMFQFGTDLAEGFPPTPPRQGPPPASILDPFFREWEHRAKCIAEPPDGYGCIVSPKRVTVDREFTIAATFAASPIDTSNGIQDAWWRGLSDVERERFPVEVRVDSTKAFDLSNTVHRLELGQVGRVVSASFLVRPAVPGRHSLRITLKYPGGRREVEFNRVLKVRTRLMDIVQKVGVVIAILVGLAGLLRTFGVL